MKEFICIALAFFLGTITGILIMCCLQISASGDPEKNPKKNK